MMKMQSLHVKVRIKNSNLKASCHHARMLKKVSIKKKTHILYDHDTLTQLMYDDLGISTIWEKNLSRNYRLKLERITLILQLISSYTQNYTIYK
jgi:hypothetical protein